MLDDAARDLHAALLDDVEDELDLPLVVELFELLVGDRGDLDVEGALRESGVAVPALAGLLLGLGISPGRTVSIIPTNRTSAPARFSPIAHAYARAPPSDQPARMNGLPSFISSSLGTYWAARSWMVPSTRSSPYIGVPAGSRLSSGS